ncbi:MliC family protein [Pseudorhodoferax sp. Leaf265]|uniref:MliC family protein n=1 Tax=Pseudorhodoferax sp. Leaf265 TaxID=1736315 RepID=UPI00138F71D9|nr:MliC family protein [Pseudorhodoferax sp. Leaf265]
MTNVSMLRQAALPCLLAALSACTPVRAPLVAYTCEGGVRLDVRFERNHALLSLPGGGEARLAQQASGSGFWYAGAGHQLRGRGQALQWTVGQAQPLACLVVGP